MMALRNAMKDDVARIVGLLADDQLGSTRENAAGDMTAYREAFDAIDILFRTSGSSGTRRGSRLGRCYRDGSVYKTHIGAQYDLHYVADAKVHLGLPAMI